MMTRANVAFILALSVLGWSIIALSAMGIAHLAGAR